MIKRLYRILRPTRSVYFLVMLAFCAATLLTGSYQLALTEFGIVIVMFAVYAGGRTHQDRQIRQYLQSLPNTLEEDTQTDAPLPAVMFRMGDGAILWENPKFTALIQNRSKILEPQLQDLLPGISTDFLSGGSTESPGAITIGQRRYRVYGTRAKYDGERVGILYLADLTELFLVRDEYIRSRPVVSIILVDNYEELTKHLSEGAIAGLNAKLNQTITAWAEDYNGLLRRLESNRFLFVCEKWDMNRAMEEKFSLLEQIHQVLSPSGVPASISMGFGLNGENFEESYNFAALGIEMALSRGGDQAVVKDRFNFSFFGGRSKENETSSKVRSRVTANSLMELIGQSSQVFVMGHKNADLDALGAAVGVACLCRKKGKKCSIVIDEEKNNSGKLLAELKQTPEYRDSFVSGQEALLHCDNHSVLVVVDTNRPDQVENQQLLQAINKVCVIDHHRRAADYIDPVVVAFHETYASSASELVTELITYAVESTEVLPIEAKSLMAGICLDTKFFNVRTGQGTFDAAAALNRLGADTTEVKLLLQSDFNSTMEKYQIIKAAVLYREEIAISALTETTSRVRAAQAADELLNISGISASFVMYPDDDQVIISARSIGSANVQNILEPLGGGGNAATAGAQVKGKTVEQVQTMLKESIDKFYEK